MEIIDPVNNYFNNYFSEIGRNFAQPVQSQDGDFGDFLGPRNDCLYPITDSEMINILNR